MLADNICMPPMSSSYETRSFNEANRALNTRAFKSPTILLQVAVGYPLLVFCNVVASGPVLALLFAIVAPLKDETTISNWEDALNWFLSGNRLALYFAIRAVRGCVQPFIYLGCAIVVSTVIK